MRTSLRVLAILAIVGVLAGCIYPAIARSGLVAVVTPAAPVTLTATAVAGAIYAPTPTPPQAEAAAPAPTPGPGPIPPYVARRAPTLVPDPVHPADRMPTPTPAAGSHIPTPVAPARPTRPAHHQPSAPSGIAGVGIARDISYVEYPGVDPCHTRLDIYAPAEASGLPVLIYVHGGGWSSGDKAGVGAKAAYFTGRRFVFVSINYRLIPVAWPGEQAADVAEAVAWVKDNISAYGGDGERIFALGHSAGAHLTALIANDETYLRRAGHDLTALRGVILLDSGAYDVEQLMHSPDAQLDVYRMPFGADPGAWRRLSPRAHVARGKGTPPHLLLLATVGGQRRPGAEGLAAALRDAGVYAHVADASAFRDHVSVNEALGLPGDPPTAAVQAFLDMLLRGTPEGLGGSEVLKPGP